MTRRTSARVAGFTFLLYTAAGIGHEFLMHRATNADGVAAKLARIAAHAMDVRVTIVLTVLECLSALVLAVTLYGITREQDHELAMLGLTCRVAEGVTLHPLGQLLSQGRQANEEEPAYLPARILATTPK